MYCKECGNMISDSADVCLNCGVRIGNGCGFCDGCGEAKKSPNQDVCLNCGKQFKKLLKGRYKTKLITLLLWFFLGGIGGHLFYLGRTGKGILYIALTIGAIFTFGITALVLTVLLIIDLVNLLTDKLEDSHGNIITEWS